MKKNGRPRGPTSTYVKTLVALPRDLRRRAKQVATRRDVPLRQVVEDALARFLQEEDAHV